MLDVAVFFVDCGILVFGFRNAAAELDTAARRVCAARGAALQVHEHPDQQGRATDLSFFSVACERRNCPSDPSSNRRETPSAKDQARRCVRSESAQAVGVGRRHAPRSRSALCRASRRCMSTRTTWARRTSLGSVSTRAAISGSMAKVQSVSTCV